MVNDHQQNIEKRYYGNEPFFTQTLYLWGKYMILKIMLTSNTYCLWVSRIFWCVQRTGLNVSKQSESRL